MPGSHLDPRALARAALRPDEIAHLAGCVRCRAARLQLETESPDTTGPTHSDLPLPRLVGLHRGSRVGPWVVESLIGHGGMASVYRARHQLLQRVVAVKILHRPSAEANERLIQEGRLQASLDHPNILSVLNIEYVDDAPALILEHVDGPDLATRISAPPRLTQDEIDGVVDGVLSGLSAAHDAGLVHRDLKPSNVLLADGCTPKIGDFGLARVLGSGALGLTGSARMGTPAYMAPEQHHATGDVDQRADIYALGCMLYELVTGRRCNQGRNYADVVRRAEQGEHAPLSADEVPERVIRAIEAALAPDPAERAGSCAELRALWEGRAGANVAPTRRVLLQLRSRTWGRTRPTPGGGSLADLEREHGAQRTDRPQLLSFPSTSLAVRYLARHREVLAERVTRSEVGGALCIGEGALASAVLERLIALVPPDGLLVTAPEGDGFGQFHGHYQLPGLDAPVAVYQPRDAGEPSRSRPPDGPHGWAVEPDANGWRAVTPVPHALPASPPGRVDDPITLASMLDEHRLVRVAGLAGSGRTTLALRHAHATLGGWRGGAWYVALGGAVTPAELGERVARTARLDGHDDLHTLAAELCRNGRCLLVLDDADDLDSDAVELVAGWCREASELRVLLVGAAGARAPAVCPALLDVPSTEPTIAEAHGSSAMRRFAEWVALTRIEWAFTREDLRPVWKVCQLLRGHPLALALAAGATAVLGVNGACTHLVGRIGTVHGLEDVLPRTLWWCWGDLDADARSVWAQCAVFEGTFDARGAAQVIRCERPVADVLKALVDRRLVDVRDEAFVLARAVRSFCAQRLVDAEAFPGSGAAFAEAAHARHAAWCARDATPEERTRDLPDVVVACRRSVAADEAFLAVALARAVGDCTSSVAALLAAEVLQMPSLTARDRGAMSVLAAQSHRVAAQLAAHCTAATVRAGRDAVVTLEAALRCFERAEHTLGVAQVFSRIGELQALMRRPQAARLDFQRAAAAFLAVDRPGDAARALLRKAALEQDGLFRDDFALASCQSAAAAARRAGDEACAGEALVRIARIEGSAGRHRAAATAAADARKLCAAADNRFGEARAVQELALLDERAGRADAARRRRHEARTLMAEPAPPRQADDKIRELCATASQHRSRGRSDEAIWTYQAALRAWRRAPGSDRALLAEIQVALTQLHARP
ncbi:MAG: serine/threonine-protein kinase [Myxococcota bacterium]